MSSQPEPSSSFEFYRYKPSIVVAGIAIGAFALTTVVHTYQLVRRRNWVCILLVIGGLCEAVSYALRILSAKETPNYTLGLYVASQLPSLLAPALFAACIYVCLGRIIASIGAEVYSVVRLSWLTKFFVTGDILGLLIQGAGGVIMPRGTYEDYKLGSNIAIGGLAVLVFYISLFLIVTTIFSVKIYRKPTPLALQLPKLWLRDLQILYITSFFIFVRSIFRLLEYAGGNDSWLMSHEWIYYVFDTILMWLVLVLFNIWPPPPKGGRKGVSDEETGYEGGRGGMFSMEGLRSRSHSWIGKGTNVKTGLVETESA